MDTGTLIWLNNCKNVSYKSFEIVTDLHNERGPWSGVVGWKRQKVSEHRLTCNDVTNYLCFWNFGKWLSYLYFEFMCLPSFTPKGPYSFYILDAGRKRSQDIGQSYIYNILLLCSSYRTTFFRIEKNSNLS